MTEIQENIAETSFILGEGGLCQKLTSIYLRG